MATGSTVDTASAAPACPSAPAPKPHRVLACVQCQQRKVKCDRKFPCANCVRQQVECTPALAPRQRRQRFPERDLLDRIRHYEDLLRRHNIGFRPLHGESHMPASTTGPGLASALRHVSLVDDGRVSDSLSDATPEASTDLMSAASTPKAVDIWDAIHAKVDHVEDDGHSGDDDLGDAVNESAWDRLYHNENHDQFLFGAGSVKTNVELFTFHPEQIQIIRLWQIYLENVHPLLLVTHTPTLQARILNAVSNLAAINAELEALIFGIYCVAIVSLAEDECFRLFATPKDTLARCYQFACRQALLKCKVLRSHDRDCLVALFLYLVSVAHETNPRSMSSMLAIAIHIAQRLGIHSELTYAKYGAFDAEVCRRLWWSLTTFNHRICELSEYKVTALTPTWDCQIPLNLHDSEIRPEMRTAPVPHEEPTEALFAIVRYHQADYIRHSTFHLNFVNPSLNTISQPNRGDLATLERMIEDKYLASCDPENPLHFMTLWSARGFLARNRLLEHYSIHPSSDTKQIEVPREAAIAYALRMLECDTKLRTSSLIKGYLWFVHFHSPMFAYVHVLRYLREWPESESSLAAWVALSENYAVHLTTPKSADAIVVICSRLVIHAWQAHENSVKQLAEPMDMPRIVLDIRAKAMQLRPDLSPQRAMAQYNSTVGTSESQHSVPMSMDYSCQGMGLHGFTGNELGGYGDMPLLATSSLDMSKSWDPFDWRSFGLQG